jgi:hypothetical protein
VHDEQEQATKCHDGTNRDEALSSLGRCRQGTGSEEGSEGTEVKFRVLILWHWNGWVGWVTDTPWPDLHSKYHIGDVQELTGDFRPWSLRFMTSHGDIIIIDMPSGTLD